MDRMDTDTADPGSAVTAAENTPSTTTADTPTLSATVPPTVATPERSSTPINPAIADENSNYPKTRFFLGRPDGTMTPLIAVDELPNEVEIVDVPKLLPYGQLLEMTNLGSADRSLTRYGVRVRGEDVGPLQASSAAMGGDENAGESGANVAQWVGNVTATAESFHSAISTPAPSTPATTPSAQDATTRTAAAPHTPMLSGPSVIGRPIPIHNYSGYTPLTRGVFGRKIYCSHWLRTGECDYTQLGCAYKHEMPDAETLAALGFRPQNIPPRWFREAGFALPPSNEAELEWRARPGADFSQMPAHEQQRDGVNQLARFSTPPPLARPSLGNHFSARPTVGNGGSGRSRFPTFAREFTPRGQSRRYSPPQSQHASSLSHQMSPFAPAFTPMQTSRSPLLHSVGSPSIVHLSSALPSPRPSDNSDMTMSAWINQSPSARRQYSNPWFHSPPQGAAQNFGFPRVQPQPQPSRGDDNLFRGILRGPSPHHPRRFVDDEGTSNASGTGSTIGGRNGNGNGNGNGQGNDNGIAAGNGYNGYGTSNGLGSTSGNGHGSSSDPVTRTYATAVGAHLDRRYNGPARETQPPQ